MSCPSWPEIYESQVLAVLVSGDAPSTIMGKLVKDFGDLWKPHDDHRLELALRRLSKKHVISYNHKSKSWIRT